VITGVSLARLTTSNQQLATRSEHTRVFFEEISSDEIEDYISTQEPMDKAGAYAIQGIASRWITRIEGDYANVVGLPVALVWKMLQNFR
jgi:septum formation protein